MNEMMTREGWTECSIKAAEFANGYFARIENKPLRKWSLERKAAAAGYQASITEAANPFNGQFSKSQIARIREDGEDILEGFLQRGRFDKASCFETMADIKDLYRRSGVADYNYGHAQKWVNMAVKYYIVCKSCYIFDESANGFLPFGFTKKVKNRNGVKIDVKRAFEENPAFNEYELFAVDSIMINLVGRELDVAFSGEAFPVDTWYVSDERAQFNGYWQAVENRLATAEISMPFLWELSKYTPSAKRRAKAAARGMYFVEG